MRLVFCFTQHVLMNKNILQECLSLFYQFARISVVYHVYYIHAFCLFFLNQNNAFESYIGVGRGKCHIDRRGLFSFSKISKLSWFQNVKIYATELLVIFFMINQISKTSWLLTLKRYCIHEKEYVYD